MPRLHRLQVVAAVHRAREEDFRGEQTLHDLAKEHGIGVFVDAAARRRGLAFISLFTWHHGAKVSHGVFRSAADASARIRQIGEHR